MSCGESSYLTNSSSCASCQSPCLSCSSLTVCTSCPANYVLDSGYCYKFIDYPCSTQVKGVCTACYLGFNLKSGSCVVDTSCNATSTCKSCDKYQYLKNRKCFACTMTTNCDFCDPTAPAKCLSCSAGYYVTASSGRCTLCSSRMTGCT